MSIYAFSPQWQFSRKSAAAPAEAPVEEDKEKAE